MRKLKGLVCAVALMVAVYCMNGCTISFGASTNYTYKAADKYVAGDREISDKIETIEIDYLSGDVKIVQADTDSISIKESANKKVSDDLKVHTWVEGSTLHVRYCDSSKKINLTNLDKKLEITIPDDVQYKNLIIDMASGSVDAECDAKDYDLSAASGDIVLKQSGESDKIKIDTASGGIAVTMDTADKVDVSAASGDILVNAVKVDDFTADTASGSNEYHFENVPEKSDIQSASGSVKVFLPEDADLTAFIDTASGDITYDFAFEKNGDDYVCGKGSNKMKVDTASGDVKIKKN